MASGAIPVPKVHEDELVFAIRDINPQAPTHALVIPVDHVVSAADLDGSTTRDARARCSRSRPGSPPTTAWTAAGGW